ncbi:uncharacterized protein LOC124485733 [Xyrichtys novacula]|uniref:Uncharacterized protein LOC124485733 n=1 Tax=Xyrichtys novacula TaxID=13765 RepID=A0AAV1GL62_XYRNO|nr:uncharacterized protein LOC124485733 [Xyrichtys novacula]
MSSADKETGAEAVSPATTFQQAIANQECVLAQHDELLRSLVSSNHVMLNQISELTTQLRGLAGQIAKTAPPGPALAANPGLASVSVPPPFREPVVPVPERYRGELGSCQAFLTQVSLVFEMQPLSYASDRSKIAYTIGLLSGQAREWGTAVWGRQDSACESYAAFVAEMRKVFDHPVSGNNASHRLMAISQGTRSVAEFAVEFRTLAAESSWNDGALQGAFYKGLGEALKDELATRDDSPDLDHLIALAIKIDNRLRERRRERSARSVLGPTRTPSAPGPRTQPDPPPESLPEPMQIGRAHLTESEKLQRRSANLCLYCGRPGHYIAFCPARPPKGPARQ